MTRDTSPPIAPALLAWYDRARRDLPWRRAPSAWKTLVSELMLQQTGVVVVEPFFRRFVARFPDARALADADEGEVTALWSGLGYYARARNLHRAARAVVERFGGEIPGDEQALRELPGVGPYTAAAVAAIAFGARTFALDGNAARVMARLHGVRAPIDRPATRVELRALGEALVPAARPGDFAQAVMELGALVCTPRAPGCAACPLAGACRARAEATVGDIPAKTARPERPRVRVACAYVVRRGRVLLVRNDAGLLAGTWTLPAAAIDGGGGGRAGAGAGAGGGAGAGAGWSGGGGDGRAGGPRAARAAARALGIVAARVVARGQVRHVFTHRDVTAEVFELAPRPGSRVAPGPDRRWVDPRALAGLGISTFTRKTLAAVLDAPPKRDNGPIRP